MTTSPPCAAWGCLVPVSYDKPLCYEHWRAWDDGLLEECQKCHWFLVDPDEFVAYSEGGAEGESPRLCDICLAHDAPEFNPFLGRPPDPRPVNDHVPLQRHMRWVYLLKLADASFNAGQTTELTIRLQEHRDGLQRQTRGKSPKLVYFEKYEGHRSEVDPPGKRTHRPDENRDGSTMAVRSNQSHTGIRQLAAAPFRSAPWGDLIPRLDIAVEGSFVDPEGSALFQRLRSYCCHTGPGPQ